MVLETIKTLKGDKSNDPGPNKFGGTIVNIYHLNPLKIGVNDGELSCTSKQLDCIIYW